MASTNRARKGADPAVAEYWRQARRPLVSLVFVAPMLVAYEGGLLLLGPQAMRNGADVWLRRFLELLGFSQYFLLPVLTCGILLSWHHLKRDHWRCPNGVFCGMLLESMGFGLLLVMVAQLQGLLLELIPSRIFAFAGPAATTGQIVAFFGAGIYEELLFRLMFLPLLAAVLRAGGGSPRASVIGAVLISSLVFAAAHYRLDLAIGQWQLSTTIGDAFQWPSFCFRVNAGIFFSLLFIYRGFGIAAGSHALYDILVSLL